MKNDKIAKISPLEELKQRKLVLERECEQEEERFYKAVDEFKSSWKGLLLNSILSSSKSTTLSLFSPSKGKKNQSSAADGSFFQKLLPLAWTVLQPILMRMVMNRVKDMFRKSKK